MAVAQKEEFEVVGWLDPDTVSKSQYSYNVEVVTADGERTKVSWKDEWKVHGLVQNALKNKSIVRWKGDINAKGYKSIKWGFVEDGGVDDTPAIGSAIPKSNGNHPAVDKADKKRDDNQAEIRAAWAVKTAVNTLPSDANTLSADVVKSRALVLIEVADQIAQALREEAVAAGLPEGGF